MGGLESSKTAEWEERLARHRTPSLTVRPASGAEIEFVAGPLEATRAVVGELARVECQFAASRRPAGRSLHGRH